MGPDSAPPGTGQPADPVPEQPPPQEAAPCPTQRSSLRQANRGTFQRMLAQRLQEDQDYAEFERAAEARLRRGKRPAPHPEQPAVAPAAAAAAGGGLGPDGGVVVKKRRGRPPKPRPPEPPKPRLMGTLMGQISAVVSAPCDCQHFGYAPAHDLVCAVPAGAHLEAVLARVRGAVEGSGMAPGTPVWVKVRGWGPACAGVGCAARAWQDMTPVRAAATHWSCSKANAHTWLLWVHVPRQLAAL